MGERRIYVGCRVGPRGVAFIQARADKESSGNQSEMIRRLLRYAVDHMPPGWGAKP